MLSNEMLCMLALNLLLVGIIIVGEHFLLTAVYSKRSSLQRLFVDRSDSAKNDLSFFAFYYFIMPFIEMSAMYLTIPGLVWVATIWLLQKVGCYPLNHSFLVNNPVLWVALFLLLYDFAHYVAHVFMHKLSFMWNIHKIHHAATEFNITTGIRESLAERAFKYVAVIFFVRLVIGFQSPEIAMAVVIIRTAIDLLQHSDLPWDYGILGYIIASPRFHRFHHSSEKEDLDSNYGDIFSFWDYIFRTIKPRYMVSPAIADTCELGLDSAHETTRVNSQWLTCVFNHTLPSYSYSLLKALLSRISRARHSS